MPKLIQVAFLPLIASSGLNCFADTPLTGMYIIKTDKLIAVLKEKLTLSKFSQSDLEKISEYTASVGQSGFTDFRISTPAFSIQFTSDYGTWPPPLPGSACSFNFNIFDKIKSESTISINGALVYTNETLKQTDTEPILLNSLPNTTIRINNDWKTKSYSLLIIFVNAKH